jgi:hypothetical protein
MGSTVQFSPATLKLRYLPLGVTLIGTAALAAPLWQDPRQLGYLVPLAAFAGLALVGLSDLFQRKPAILRNYPIAAHLRFLLEKIRPEMRQYFFEDDKEGLPFPATSAPSSISAPRACSTNATSVRATTFMPVATNGCTIRSPPSPPPASPFGF